MNILFAVLVLGGMGLLFGLVLTAASKFFAVPANPKRDAIREVMPGANCGACGFPGCDACADAIASGKAPANTCPVGGAALAAKIGGILGVEADSDSEKLVARMQCQGTVETCKTKYDYTGIRDCVAASTVSDGPKACRFACIGLGTCVKACPFDAIHIDPDKQIAVVDEEKCQSCGKCVSACPKNVLSMQPKKLQVSARCHNTDRGAAVRSVCSTGCGGCGECVEACKFGAIEIVGNLPRIDASKCRNCMMCAEVCPNRAIEAAWEERKIAVIDKDACVGCTICKKNCPFGAIVGELKQKHLVTDVCTGCGVCAEKCPRKCITMKVRSHERDRRPVEIPAAPAKPKLSPEVQAKIDAALKAKAEKEAAAKKES